MPPDEKFCTACGAQNPRDRIYCTNCGARFGAGHPLSPQTAPAPVSPPSPAIVPLKKITPPVTLHALLQLIALSMRQNIRSMAKSLIKTMIIAFALVLLLHTFLQVTRLTQEELVQMIIAASGLGSHPNAMLFWFLFTAILAFFWSQVTGRGIRGMLSHGKTVPRWIYASAMTTGSAAFPLIMAGIAAALVVRLLLLTVMTDIQFLILMFSIIFSQQESLFILAMSLGWSDLRRMVKKTGPVIPAPGFPVMAVLGAFCGFILALFTADSLPLIAVIAILIVAVSAGIWYRKRIAAPSMVSPAGTSLPGGGK